MSNTAPVKKYCSLQEALEIVGRRAFPAEWTGQEAELPPKDFATLRRFVRSTRALLTLLHDGRVAASFIPDGSTLEEQRQKIIPLSWPNPARFLAKPPFGDLWFDIISSRGARRPTPEDNPPAWYQRFANTPLWHAYSPLVGQIEIDQEALRLASGDGTGQVATVDQEPKEDDDSSPNPPPVRRRGRRPQYEWALFHAEIARKVGKDPDGFPVIQADLEHTMTDWCAATWGENNCPSESTIRSQVSKYYNDDSQDL